MKKWYEELFTNYAKQYDEESYTGGTRCEVDFLEKEIGFDKTKRILDVGCGTGRHSIELARRGYKVVGIDLSDSQLSRAKEKAKEAGVDVVFTRLDARDLLFDEEFDAVIMLCEGGFSLMETDEENFEILKGCARALKKGGRFIFTALSVFFPLFNDLHEFYTADQTTGCSNEKAEFDIMSFREHSVVKMKDDDGVEKTIECNERYYAPAEIRWMLHSLGFKDIHISGGRVGGYSRDTPLTKEEFEVLTIAVKG